MYGLSIDLLKSPNDFGDLLQFQFTPVRGCGTLRIPITQSKERIFCKYSIVNLSPTSIIISKGKFRHELYSLFVLFILTFFSFFSLFCLCSPLFCLSFTETPLYSTSSILTIIRFYKMFLEFTHACTMNLYQSTNKQKNSEHE